MLTRLAYSDETKNYCWKSQEIPKKHAHLACSMIHTLDLVNPENPGSDINLRILKK